ncbi:hypothetical protein [Streptacidiphilus jiangxiensis]|uniref:Uncharacterized protein n=1 Tax=Streptacidiphilus jiangxiensis TaxID=235985 RepID=A0A1H7Z1Z5_STRJI|nr:hypothetical protein [Streptacidiphilus jiangxiensis]SEM52245.1 hypothetical protein SAMN05414137_13220 [Streptacidiphilus jiangxiensis]
MSEEIKRQLRESARVYQPDRARMLARAERGLAGPVVRHRTRSFTRSGPRTVLAGLATAGLLATGGFAVADIVHGPSPSTTVTTPTESPSPMPRPTPSDSATTPATPSTAAGGGHQPQPTGPRPAAGPLWSAGSVDPHSTVYWSQSDFVLRTKQPLTSLTLELRVAQTGGVQSTGSWRTLPVDEFTVTVREVGGALVYRWVLKPGLTVPAGQYEFAAQFNHSVGVRDAGGDGYRVDVRTSAGSPVAVWGGFLPAR